MLYHYHHHHRRSILAVHTTHCRSLSYAHRHVWCYTIVAYIYCACFSGLLVRERSALATIIVSRRVVMWFCLSFCLSAVSLKCFFSGSSYRNWTKFYHNVPLCGASIRSSRRADPGLMSEPNRLPACFLWYFFPPDFQDEYKHPETANVRPITSINFVGHITCESYFWSGRI